MMYIHSDVLDILQRCGVEVITGRSLDRVGQGCLNSLLGRKSVTRKLGQISLAKADTEMVLRLITDGLWANVLIGNIRGL